MQPCHFPATGPDPLLLLSLQAKETAQGAVDYTTQKASEVTQAVADATKSVQDTVGSTVSCACILLQPFTQQL